MKSIISQRISSSIGVKQLILDNQQLIAVIEEISKLCISTFNNNNKILLCGNGGSASDAQHLAAELTGRYYFDRAPLDAEALHVNTSYLTAVANDYSFEEIYSRLIKAKGRSGDVLFAFSTSGNSANIIKAISTARALNMKIVGFTGKTGGKMVDLCDFMINIPSEDTPRIQECHILVGHIICEIIESNIFPKV